MGYDSWSELRGVIECVDCDCDEDASHESFLTSMNLCLSFLVVDAPSVSRRRFEVSNRQGEQYERKIRDA